MYDYPEDPNRPMTIWEAEEFRNKELMDEIREIVLEGMNSQLAYEAERLLILMEERKKPDADIRSIDEELEVILGKQTAFIESIDFEGIFASSNNSYSDDDDDYEYNSSKDDDEDPWAEQRQQEETNIKNLLTLSILVKEVNDRRNRG